MPIYEYECKGCGHGFELRQSFSAEPVAQCPACQGKAIRVLQSVPIIFKGSGFYVNDYKRSSVGDVAPAKKPPADDNKATSDIKLGPNETKSKTQTPSS